MAQRKTSTVQRFDAGSIVRRLGPGLLAGTAVLVAAVVLAGGWVTQPFGLAASGDTAADAGRQLLVLRPESSPTGAPIRNIWVIHADGTGLHRITNDSEEILDFAAAPDGKRLVFVGRDGLTATALWRIDADGANRTRLTPATDRAVYTEPAWSPAGDAILYVRRDLLTPRPPSAPPSTPPSSIPVLGVPRLWAMTPDGTPLKRVYGQADEIGDRPIWSPTGAAAVFQEGMSQTGMTNLVITDLAAAFITVPSGSVTRPTWSPDGQWLAYDEAMPQGKISSQIMLVRADGTGRRPLFTEPHEQAIAPSWSPDGTVLAFVRRSPDPPPAGAVAAVSEVWTATRDGQIGRRLFGGQGRGAEDLAWSLDGGMLAATRYTIVGAPERGVWVVDADGSHARELVKDATHATWLP